MGPLRRINQLLFLRKTDFLLIFPNTRVSAVVVAVIISSSSSLVILVMERIEQLRWLVRSETTSAVRTGQFIEM
jgi:hypothetical protein